MSKRFLAFVLAAIIVLTAAFSAGAMTIDECPGLDVDNDTDDNFIIMAYTGENPDLVIPESAYGKVVMRFAKQALYKNQVVETLTMHDKMTVAWQSAVRKCDKLRAVYFSKNMSALWNYSFAYNGALEAAFLGDTAVSTLYEGAFASDTALKYVSLPDGLETLGAQTFNNTAVRNVVLPETVTSVGYRCFASNENLKAVYIPSGVKSFGAEIFKNSPNVTVYGEAESAAQTYCEENSVAFKVISKDEFPSDVRGDVNNDGKLSIADAVMIFDELGGKETELLSQNADYNGDGVLTEADAEEIVEIALNKSYSASADDQAFAESELEDNTFGTMQILGVQKKIKSTDCMRFVSVVASDILSAAEDYGYVFSTSQNSIPEARAQAEENLSTTDYGTKASCLGTETDLGGEFGSVDFSSTDYKYVTSVVNDITDENTVISARLYVVINGKTYYGKYINKQGTFAACAANLAAFSE